MLDPESGLCVIGLRHDISKAGRITRSGDVTWRLLHWPTENSPAGEPLCTFSSAGEITSWLKGPNDPRTILLAPFIVRLTRDFFASSSRWLGAVHGADPGLFPKGVSASFSVALSRQAQRFRLELPARVTIRRRAEPGDFLQSWASRLDYRDAGVVLRDRRGARWAREAAALENLTPQIRGFFGRASLEYGRVLTRLLDLEGSGPVPAP